MVFSTEPHAAHPQPTCRCESMVTQARIISARDGRSRQQNMDVWPCRTKLHYNSTCTARSMNTWLLVAHRSAMEAIHYVRTTCEGLCVKKCVCLDEDARRRTLSATSASDLATPLLDNVCIRPGNPIIRLHQTWQPYHTIPYHTNVCIRPGNPIVLDPLPSSVYTTFRMLCTCGRTHRQYFFYFLTVKFGENKRRQSMWCGVCVCVGVVASSPREI